MEGRELKKSLINFEATLLISPAPGGCTAAGRSVEKRWPPPRTLGQAPRVRAACFLGADSQKPAAWASSKCRWAHVLPQMAIGVSEEGGPHLGRWESG